MYMCMCIYHNIHYAHIYVYTYLYIEIRGHNDNTIWFDLLLGIWITWFWLCVKVQYTRASVPCHVLRMYGNIESFQWLSWWYRDISKTLMGSKLLVGSQSTDCLPVVLHSYVELPKGYIESLWCCLLSLNVGAWCLNCLIHRADIWKSKQCQLSHLGSYLNSFIGMFVTDESYPISCNLNILESISICFNVLRSVIFTWYWLIANYITNDITHFLWL